MYQLYYYPGNANLAPHILLEEIGADYELVLVDRNKNEQKSPAYLKLNPAGRIPVLVDGGLVLYEAAAICLHLADRHAGGAGACARQQRAGGVLQVAHLPHQHGAGRTSALLLSGAPGR